MEDSTYKELKKGGFMRQIQNEKFSLRLRGSGGQINSDQLQKVSEIANIYGNGYVHLTSRQGIEIPFIDFKDINAVKAELATVGLEPGACGPRVRTVTACQGNAICGSGLIETSNLAKELDVKYFAKDLPHKFKIGVTGCRNNCLKAEENDLGIKGGLKPTYNSSTCNHCGVCEVICPAKAINVDKNNYSITLDESKCVYCGKCVKSCPADAWTGKSGYITSFGGLFGNNISFGKNLIPLIEEKATLFKVVDATIEFFKDNANAGERFRFTLDRVGIDKLRIKLEEVIK